MTSAGLALLLALCPCKGAAPLERPTAIAAVWDSRQAIAAARQTPLRVYLAPPVNLETCEAEARFIPESERWVVTFTMAGRQFLEVNVSAETGAILDGTFRDAAGPLPTAAEALSAVRADPAVGEYLRQNPHTDLVPSFWPQRLAWWVRLFQDGRMIGGALVYSGLVVSSGPWTIPPGDWPRQLWHQLRPGFSLHQVLYICAGLFVVVAVTARRVTAWYALDLLALLLLVPGLLLVTPMPAWGYPILWCVTLYLFVRAVLLSRGSGDLVPPPRPRGLAEVAPPRLLAGVLALVLTVQGLCAMGGVTETGAADVAGVVGGQQTLDTGYLPLGLTRGDFDKYGPLHYLLYGLAARVFPSGVAWQGYDFQQEEPRPDCTSARLVTFLFHVLTVAGLVGIGGKHLGSRRLGLVMALAYVLFPPTVERLTHANRIVPGAWGVLAFWAWPNPLVSGLLLGLATAQWWFPAFLVPLWFVSFPRWRARLKFAGAIAVIGAAFFAFSMRAPPGQTLRERWDLLLQASLFYPKEVAYYQTVAATDGFWRQVRDRMPELGPLRGAVMAAFPVFCLLLLFVPRRKGARQVAALTAAVLLGSQLGKNLHGCRYVGWYAPMLLVVLLTPRGRRTRGAEPAGGPPTSSATRVGAGSA